MTWEPPSNVLDDLILRGLSQVGRCRNVRSLHGRSRSLLWRRRILESRQCLLLAAGKHKAKAIRETIEGPITAQVTASALQLHRDVIAILDEEAARLLERRDYYLEVERAQAALQAGQLGKPGGAS